MSEKAPFLELEALRKEIGDVKKHIDDLSKRVEALPKSEDYQSLARDVESIQATVKEIRGKCDVWDQEIDELRRMFKAHEATEAKPEEKKEIPPTPTVAEKPVEVKPPEEVPEYVKISELPSLLEKYGVSRAVVEKAFQEYTSCPECHSFIKKGELEAHLKGESALREVVSALKGAGWKDEDIAERLEAIKRGKVL